MPKRIDQFSKGIIENEYQIAIILNKIGILILRIDFCFEFNVYCNKLFVSLGKTKDGLKFLAFSISIKA